MRDLSEDLHSFYIPSVAQQRIELCRENHETADGESTLPAQAAPDRLNLGHDILSAVIPIVNLCTYDAVAYS